MHTRKLVKHGESSLSVTLPSKWVNNNHLKKGDEIKVDEKGTYLVIGGRGKHTKSEKIITIPDEMPTSALMHYTAALYRGGYDHVKFRFSKAEIYEAIEKVTGTDLNSWDIIENKKNSCVIDSISSVDHTQFENVLKRLLYGISELSKDSLDAIKNKNIEEIKLAQTKENTINRNANFCERILIKEGYDEPDKIPFLFYIIKELENIGDEYNSICHSYRESQQINKKTIKLYGDVNDILNQFKRLYLKEEAKKPLNIQNAAEVHSQLREKMKEGYKLLEGNQKDDCILHHLITVLRKTKSCLGCLFSIMIVEEKKKKEFTPSH